MNKCRLFIGVLLLGVRFSVQGMEDGVTSTSTSTHSISGKNSVGTSKLVDMKNTVSSTSAAMSSLGKNTVKTINAKGGKSSAGKLKFWSRMPDDIQNFCDTSSSEDEGYIKVDKKKIYYSKIPELRYALAEQLLIKGIPGSAYLLIEILERDPANRITRKKLGDLINLFSEKINVSDRAGIDPCLAAKIPSVFSRIVELLIRHYKKNQYEISLTLKESLQKKANEFKKVYSRSDQTLSADWLVESIKRIPVTDKNNIRFDLTRELISIVICSVTSNIRGGIDSLANIVGLADRQRQGLKAKWYDISYTLLRIARRIGTNQSQFDKLVKSQFDKLVSLTNNYKAVGVRDVKVLHTAIDIYGYLTLTSSSQRLRGLSEEQLKTFSELNEYSVWYKFLGMKKSKTITDVKPLKNHVKEWLERIEYYNEYKNPEQLLDIHDEVFPQKFIGKSSNNQEDIAVQETNKLIEELASKLYEQLTNKTNDSKRSEAINSILNKSTSKQLLDHVLNYHYKKIDNDNLFGMTPLHLVVKNGFNKILQTFLGLKTARADEKDDIGNTAAHLALIKDNLEALKLIILYDKSVLNVENKRREFLSTIAANKNKPELYALLQSIPYESDDQEIKNRFASIIAGDNSSQPVATSFSQILATTSTELAQQPITADSVSEPIATSSTPVLAQKSKPKPKGRVTKIVRKKRTLHSTQSRNRKRRGC